MDTAISHETGCQIHNLLADAGYSHCSPIIPIPYPDVWSRLKVLLRSGALNALNPTGLIEKTVKRVARQGRAPDGDFLGAMGITNASSSWLLTGQGSPFAIAFFEDDESATDFLDDLLAESQSLYLIANESRFCVASVVEVVTSIANHQIEHKDITILAGNLGELSRQRALAAVSSNRVLQMEISAEDFDMLIACVYQ